MYLDMHVLVNAHVLYTCACTCIYNVRTCTCTCIHRALSRKIFIRASDHCDNISGGQKLRFSGCCKAYCTCTRTCVHVVHDNKATQYNTIQQHMRQLFFPKMSCSGGIQTHDTLFSRQVLWTELLRQLMYSVCVCNSFMYMYMSTCGWCLCLVISTYMYM